MRVFIIPLNSKKYIFLKEIIHTIDQINTNNVMFFFKLSTKFKNVFILM